jgi:hypothetical protein
MAALRRMAMTPDLVAAGILGVLAAVSGSPVMEFQREAAGCLCYLSLAEEGGTDGAAGQGMRPKLAWGGDVEAGRQAMGTLVNLAEEVATVAFVAEAGGGEATVARRFS